MVWVSPASMRRPSALRRRSPPAVPPLSPSPTTRNRLSVRCRRVWLSAIARLRRFQQCIRRGFGAAGTITFNKGFAASFKIQKCRRTGSRSCTPAPRWLRTCRVKSIYTSRSGVEYGFYNPTVVTGAWWLPAALKAGVADYGTRLRVIFAGVQAGVTIWVPNNVAYDDLVTPPVTVPNAGGPCISSGNAESVRTVGHQREWLLHGRHSQWLWCLGGLHFVNRQLHRHG